MRDPRETLARIRAQADAALEGPWEAKSETPTMSGAVWNLRIVGKPGIRMNVTEWQHGMESAEFIAASRTDVPWLLDQVELRDKALEAVLALHKPVEVEPSETICSGCSTLRGQGETARYFPFTEYPCPTVRAITTALEGETHD